MTVAEVFIDAHLAAESFGEQGATVSSGPRVGPNTLSEILCTGQIRVIATDGLHPLAYSDLGEFQLTSDRVPASGPRPHGPFVYWFRQRFVRVVRTRMRSSATGQPARENIRRSSSLSSLVCCRWSIGSGPKANRPSDSEGPMTTEALRPVSLRSRKPGD